MRLSLSRRAGRIYLIGFMGSGKSTVGPILANTLGYNFVDLDVAIETSAGVSVAEIFRDRGEYGFRLMEREILHSISVQEKVVVALGGGALTDPGSFTIATTTGICVYLRASLDDIVARMKRKKDRPLLLAADGELLDEDSLHARIQSLLAAREPQYLHADITVDTNGGNLGRTVDRIVRKLAPFLPREA